MRNLRGGPCVNPLLCGLTSGGSRVSRAALWGVGGVKCCPRVSRTTAKGSQIREEFEITFIWDVYSYNTNATSRESPLPFATTAGIPRGRPARTIPAARLAPISQLGRAAGISRAGPARELTSPQPVRHDRAFGAGRAFGLARVMPWRCESYFAPGVPLLRPPSPLHLTCFPPRASRALPLCGVCCCTCYPARPSCSPRAPYISLGVVALQRGSIRRPVFSSPLVRYLPHEASMRVHTGGRGGIHGH